MATSVIPSEAINLGGMVFTGEEIPLPSHADVGLRAWEACRTRLDSRRRRILHLPPPLQKPFPP